jgi:hypothetical protein
MSHLLVIGKRIKTVITDLMATVATENSYSSAPLVMFKKRPNANGRAKGATLQIQKGICIVPLGVAPAGGTSDREDVGYRYLIAIAVGTLTDNLDRDDWQIAVWEQAIRQRFQNRRVGSLEISACELHTTFRPGELPEWGELADGVDATFATLTVFVRESRR